jgi:hypothetical protein
MPTQPIKGFDPEEFVKLIGSYDTGNPSEAEAMNAARLIRRMLVSNGLRLVDAMGRADVMQALDAQLQPVREESPQLKAAFVEIAELAELLKQREEIIDELQQRELASNAASNTAAVPPPQISRGGLGDGGLINGGLVAVVLFAALFLLIASTFR